MPALDKTGPQGQGPMTGRGLGYCRRGYPMGYGRHYGGRRGLGRYFGWNTPQTKEDKINDAKAYKKALEEEIEEVEKELADLNK